VIDGQAYYFPTALAEDPLTWAQAHGEFHWLKLVAPSDRPSRQGWAPSARELLLALDEAGIERAILHGWYWQNHDTVVWHNRETAKICRQHPDRFIGFAGLNLKAGSKAIEELKACRDLGFVGIGELLPPVQGYGWDDPLWDEVVAFAAGEKWPITLHFDEQIGRSHPGRIETPLPKVFDFLTRHTSVRWILSHWGGLMPFYELNPAVRSKLKHVFYNTAASPLLYDATIFKIATAAVGPGKILWASDFPLQLYRGLSAREGLVAFAEALRQDKALCPETRQKICAENWKPLLPPSVFSSA
jgi:predicted TIM-barrel fold metal-dependent hydrolase